MFCLNCKKDLSDKNQEFCSTKCKDAHLKYLERIVMRVSKNNVDDEKKDATS